MYTVSCYWYSFSWPYCNLWCVSTFISSLGCKQPICSYCNCSSSIRLFIWNKILVWAMHATKTTGPIYYIFFNDEIILSRQCMSFNFFDSICHVCWNRQTTGCILMYAIAWPTACPSLHILLLCYRHHHSIQLLMFCCGSLDPQTLQCWSNIWSVELHWGWGYFSCNKIWLYFTL